MPVRLTILCAAKIFVCPCREHIKMSWPVDQIRNNLLVGKARLATDASCNATAIGLREKGLGALAAMP